LAWSVVNSQFIPFVATWPSRRRQSITAASNSTAVSKWISPCSTCKRAIPSFAQIVARPVVPSIAYPAQILLAGRVSYDFNENLALAHFHAGDPAAFRSTRSRPDAIWRTSKFLAIKILLVGGWTAEPRDVGPYRPNSLGSKSDYQRPLGNCATSSINMAKRSIKIWFPFPPGTRHTDVWLRV